MVSVDEISCKKLLGQIKELTATSDQLILSTCNRTEIYYTAEEDHSAALIGLLFLHSGYHDGELFKEYFTIENDSDEAVRQLFTVAMGLDSKVIGDIQISNQVKNAYQWSADMQCAGPSLHRLMHTIFYTNKRVVQETDFRNGAASVSYVASELVEELAESVYQPKVLILGVGEIGADTCRNLVGQHLGEVKVVNRTASKAEKLAKECGFSHAPIDDMKGLVAWADIVVSSVRTDRPVIDRKLIDSLDLLTFKYLIDLSVPRSVASDVEVNPAVIVYNIDSLEKKADSALQTRLRSVPKVKSIIEESIAEFKDWANDMLVSPAIHRLKGVLEGIRQEEMSRYMKQLDSEQMKMMETVTKSMMQKIIKLPVLQLKAACRRGDAENLVDVLTDLFDLEKSVEVRK